MSKMSISKSKSIDYEDFSQSNFIGLNPKKIYGLRLDIVGNVHFGANQEVIYPVENFIALHDYVTDSQKFLRITTIYTPLFIVQSSNRKLLAILEKHPSKIEYNISIYDLVTLTKRRNLAMPTSSYNRKIQQVSFTHDAKSLVVLTEPPHELIYIISLDRENTIIEGHSTLLEYTNCSVCFVCDSEVSSSIIVGGKGMVSYLTRTVEKRIIVKKTLKVKFTITSMTYLEGDLLLLGTNNDELILVFHREIELQMQASELQAFDIASDKVQTGESISKHIGPLTDKRVLHLVKFPKGFAFTMFKSVFVFEKTSKTKFERKTVLTIPITIYPDYTYQIKNVAIDHKQETVVVTTKHSQIYIGVLIVPETLKTKYLKFQTLGAFMHIDSIVDMTLCSWKPILMTASKDGTIRIWNYQTEKLEMVRKFQVDVNVVALNATGLMAAIGFSDQLRIAQIFVDELNIIKTYNFPHCKEVKYSNFGHLMAAAYDDVIALTSTFNFDVLLNLKGHVGVVRCIAFTGTDKFLISAGDDGAIYQWDLETGNRVLEIVEKSSIYQSLVVTRTEPFKIYASTNKGTIRQFDKSGILARELTISTKEKCHITDVCISRSDSIMFLGNNLGHLYNVTVPLAEAGGGILDKYQFFLNGITKLRLSYDGTLLFVTTTAGTLSIWAMSNIDDHLVPFDGDLLKRTEILIPRHILEEKNELILHLELRLKQQTEEFQYQMSQNEIFDDLQLAEVHKNYCKALEEMRNYNLKLEQQRNDEINQIASQTNELREEFRESLEQLTNLNSERLMTEFHKFNKLRKSMLALRDSYEGDLKVSSGILQDTVEGLETSYKNQLDERRQLIRDLLKEMHDKKTEFMEYCREVTIENDRNMIQQQTEYEKKFLNERQEAMLWRGKAGVILKKYETSQNEIQNLLGQIENLKEEHLKSRQNMEKLHRSIEEMQKDITDRDIVINNKEKRIITLLQKNQEIEKYKNILAHKISELKSEIEPKQLVIRDRTKQVQELEAELEGLHNNNLQLELQVKDLKAKYQSNNKQLIEEQSKSLSAQNYINTLCREIYEVSGKVSSSTDLVTAVKRLCHKHSNDDRLKHYIESDAMVNAEFSRQRAVMENSVSTYKKIADTYTPKTKELKLIRENIFLMNEINKIKEENKILRTRFTKLSKKRN